MSFTHLYRISFYVMLFFATLVLSVDATDSSFAMAYPPAVAVAAVLAFLTVDRNPSLELPRGLGNALAVCAAGLAYMEYKVDDRLLLLALGHWLVYLQVILMFRTKSVEEDWYLFGLGLVQVIVGTVMSQSDTVGAILFTWAILALWVLGLFSLRRDAVRAAGGEAIPKVPGGGAAEPYPGLFNLPFLLSCLRVTLTTLALGGVIFLAMPRQMSGSRTQGGATHVQHLTGFDDEVQLGQLGEILESDDVVMSIEVFDENDNPVELPGEPLWRGVTMDEYRDGRWFRQKKRDGTNSFPQRRPRLTGQRIVRQQIKLEANDSSVLFGLRPMIDATANRGFVTPDLNPFDGSIYVADLRSGSFDYEVRSYLDSRQPQPGETTVSAARLKNLLKVPDNLRPRLKEIAQRVIDQSEPAELRDDPRQKAQVLDEFLRTKGKFGYTLKLEVIDRTIDPIEDFLVNRKEGHCEYFASALALMLRSVGVPSRVVNGFKGGDWTGLAQILSVRQKHAHSWVEAYMGEVKIPQTSDRSPDWLTLDPTPSTERDRSVARVGGFRAHFRQISDLMRYVWVFYIVGYNAERQDRILYGPLRRVALEARRGFRMIGSALEATRERLLRLLHFPTVEAFISVRGFVVSFAALLLFVVLVRGSIWLVQSLLRWWRGEATAAGIALAGAAQYRRLAQLLAECGLERTPVETQAELASHAAKMLSGLASDTRDVADVPQLVVDAFYRVRFGHLDLTPAAQQFLDNRLDSLEATLRASRA